MLLFYVLDLYSSWFSLILKPYESIDVFDAENFSFCFQNFERNLIFFFVYMISRQLHYFSQKLRFVLDSDLKLRSSITTMDLRVCSLLFC